MQENRLEYKVIGDKGPVIVMENGIGCSFYDWYFVINELKKCAKIIIYHRAGYGDSPTSTIERTTRQISIELEKLLTYIGIDREVILVGHSFGGLCVQQFAKMFPQRIKGVVLVDSTSVNFKHLYSEETPQMCKLASIDKTIERWNDMSKKNAIELKEAFEPIISSEEEALSEEFKRELTKFNLSTNLYHTMISEMKCWEKDSADIKSLQDFPDVPLYVIARDSDVAIKFYKNHGLTEQEATAYERIWRKLQKEHMLLSEKSQFFIAENSDHLIHLEKPEIIIKCIRDLISITMSN